MRRRPLLAGLPLALLGTRSGAAAPPAAASSPVSASPSPSNAPPLGVSHRTLRFPADHGAHPDTHIEWWYVTGWLSAAAGDPSTLAPEFGFQVTFFRTRTDLAETSASRFAARQLVFAHVALTDLAAGARGGGLMHDQRAAREGFGLAQTPGPSGSQVVRLRDWSLQRDAAPESPDASQMRIEVRSDRFALALALAPTQPLLLQGEAGYSQKGPDPREASHYYSEPQLAVRGRVERAGSPARDVRGRAWLDHEWSNELLPAAATGWDWVGFNLLDGSALMAFRLRRSDGSALWAGGSFRDPTGRLTVFSASDVRFEPLRQWTSPRTRAAYPVEWTLATPAGRWRVGALQDDQELDSRDSTGSVYWEGISALRDDSGAVAGYGYLELTGYAGRLRL
jgi:predicted secreted hydrolase